MASYPADPMDGLDTRSGELGAWHGRGWLLILPPATLLLLAAAHYYAPDWTNARLRGEGGAIEVSQFAFIAIASLLGFDMLRLRTVRRSGWLSVWVACAALSCFYVAGEEISWGQVVFGWSTPAAIAAINGQGETNLHNVSVWFNGVPLTILEIGVFLGGVCMPLAVRRWPELRQSRFSVILPGLSGFSCAAVAIAVRVTKNVQVHIRGGEFPLSARGGEIEELFLYAFVLIYLVELRRRLIGLSGRSARGQCEGR